MVEDSFEFSEEADYQGERKYSIKEIILRHLRKIADLSCKEFTGGYWDKRPIKTNTGVMFYEIYHEDVRKAYCNAIDFLIDIIYPMGDEELVDYLNEHEGFDSEDKEDVEDLEEDLGLEEENESIKKKLEKKRKTFRQINMMFSRSDFWGGISSYGEDAS